MNQNPNPAEAKKQILDDHRQIGELTAKVAATGNAVEMATCLKQLLPLLLRHFKEEEDEIDGLHANIQKRTPQQQNALLGLKEEHKQLLDRVHLLLSIAQETKGGGPKLQLLGKQLQERLAAHEAKETELFLDSIWTDIGEGD
jgi:hemerythrin